MLHQRPPWVREEPATRGKRLRPSHRPSATKGTMLVQQCSISLALQTREAKVVVVPPKKHWGSQSDQTQCGEKKGGSLHKPLEKSLLSLVKGRRKRGGQGLDIIVLGKQGK
ncbi:hypothetical protein J1N35_017331 [Gossypium stocksii]|uniref:Uncharacterized protein n=1 Tax=Gossypium stocksii TaxID=47602 RepID=A0A9D3VM66_9ROSI|nr:hypothetical protein J1N35_017331 [Gossypium stocksii]